MPRNARYILAFSAVEASHCHSKESSERLFKILIQLSLKNPTYLLGDWIEVSRVLCTASFKNFFLKEDILTC